ncbi:NAD(P)-dependent dehydrogenase (short-subunit alcohol dehydrogenase family) [Agromyces terreus]|uniref:NAD(P)-dependent dehydrogenase (Short-subunit alcohol dehydrogenase family) n=1 Tax=Agromyces terreus TaxID=424795 RepID=A0A9X2H6H4_9MICO|nr:SDR family NAD(P)-dependent oxidoreductase [Agromyces terreus]MCP2370924.1 NAD(P)-dependent dehydrogenase (short-subunit alcohol dehydrogenase family) [Agromyces terreus]
MAQKIIVITGASDGIGRAAARKLSADGHEVVLVGRSPEKTRALAEELGAEHHLVDFADLGSVRALAAELAAWHPRIDVLANNAGGVFGKERELTGDGHEMTFQVNYLAPFLLTQELMPTLVASRATVINTSSLANRLFARFDLDDLESARRYRPVRAYGNAKLAQILFTKELERRHGDDGVTSTAFHPGAIATNFSADRGSGMAGLYRSRLRNLVLSTPEQGASTLVFLAEGAPGDDYPTGLYFADSKPARASRRADDAALARALWDRTVAMLDAGRG